MPLMAALAACPRTPSAVSATDAGTAMAIVARRDSVIVVWLPAQHRVEAWSPLGTKTWSVELPAGEVLLGSLAVASDSRVYARGRQALYAISPDGVMAWVRRLEEFDLPDALKAPVTVPDSSVVFAAGPDLLVALAPDGVEVWHMSLPPGETLSALPVAGPNSFVTFASATTLFQVANDGLLVWRRPRTAEAARGP